MIILQASAQVIVITMTGLQSANSSTQESPGANVLRSNMDTDLKQLQVVATMMVCVTSKKVQKCKLRHPEARKLRYPESRMLLVASGKRENACSIHGVEVNT